MARDQIDMTPIESHRELVAWLEAGCRPPGEFKIGTEHEKLPFMLKDHRPVPYDCTRGICTVLYGMRDLLGWEPIMEGETIIGLADVTGGGAISLEPGGQFELSGAPLENIHQTSRELHAHLAQLREAARPLGIGFAAVGMSPAWTRAETPVMPKGRYKIMAGYMPKVGKLGLDMMFRTCTVQANLDFSSEADMVKKLRVGISWQPIATAMFANSPFTDGKPNGYLSYRAHIWTDTDPNRTGQLPFAFEPGMGFERYAEYALDVPMYFVKRGADYIDVSGTSFRDLLKGKHPKLPGERATISDWANHLSTAFPEVRLKRYLEMRGADNGPMKMICALPALWAGLLYCQPALDEAWDEVKEWTAEERAKLRADVAKLGLNAEIRGRRVQDLARSMLKLARAGLTQRMQLDFAKQDEAHYLDPLEEIVERNETQAEALLKLYNGPWKKSVDPIFDLMAY